MFGALTNGSQVYILDKREVPTLSIGTISSKTDSPQMLGGGYFGKRNIDLMVKVNNEDVKFENLDATYSISDNLKGIVISDSKDMMLQQIESMQSQSRNIIGSVDYHKKVLESCENMMMQLNPTIAREKEQEKKISELESRLGGMEGTLGNIQTMLAKALKSTNN